MERAENKRFVYEFGRFVLDPHEKTLFVEGTPLHLPAKEFETLILLVENNGKALAKDEMMQAIWQDAFVEETNLVKQISRLRKLLNANGQKYIETLPKHGYRFSAEVRCVIPVAEEPVVIEKRTVKRLTVRVENEIEDAPLALPKRKKKSRLAVFALLGLIISGTAVFYWFWQSQKQTLKPDDGKIIFLTEASQDNSGAHWVSEDQIYFVRRVSNTRVESWRMNADGSNQQRANTEIKNLLRGRWSPDGKKVVFVKEGDNKAFYLADSNGGGEIVLPFSGGNMDWSPDGSQFVYQTGKNALGNTEVFLYTVATGENVNLTNSSFGAADPSFSPDGKQIAFVSWRDDNAEIYVMNADGSNVRRITNHPAWDNYPVFTPDGTAIAFQSNRENERTGIYLQNLEGDLPPVKIAGHDSDAGIHPKCWSADGTQILFWTNQNGKPQIVLSSVEPYPARVVLSDEKADLSSPRIAPDGKRILYEARLADRSIELRLTDLETKKTTTVYKTTPDYPQYYLLAPAWSPDGQKIAFANKSSGNSEVFLMNADGSGLRNLTNDPLPDSAPFFSPEGGEIIFTRDFYGTAQLYRMKTDGSNQRLLTENKGHNLGAALSPDGLTLAFSGDRKNVDSRGLDIFLLDFNNPANEKRLTARRLHETYPAFSPDGKRIAFVSIADGNAEIYLINTDGTGLFRVTRSLAEDAAPQFSKDGGELIFASNKNGKFAIYGIELP